MQYLSSSSHLTVPRQVFGNLQSRQFPIFFAYSTLVSLGLLTLDLKLRPALLTSFKHAPFQTLKALNTSTFWGSTAGLSVVTGLVHAVNGLVVTPKASECMFERHRLERIEGKSSEAVSQEQEDFNLGLLIRVGPKEGGYNVGDRDRL